jgi:tetratricopeptide (TPR) repeat protein
MVAEGFAKGRVQPLARGFQDIYERQAQPKMFWASMLWNGFCAGFFFLIAFAVWQDASPQAVQDHCYNQHGDFGARDAYQSCTKLIEGREKRTYLTLGDAYVYRAIAAERMGDRSRALADYSEGIRLEPTNEYAYLQRGLLHLGAMRLDQSIADFSRAHELGPKSIWPLADRGLAYAWKNDRPRAEADFAAVRGIDPTNIVVLHGQGVLEMTSGNLEAAVDRFTAAVRQDPSDAWAIQMRADCYQQMGQFEKAREDRRRLVRLREDGSD